MFKYLLIPVTILLMSLFSINHEESETIEEKVLACNIDVTASANPMVLCEPGQVFLNASISGAASEILWEPSNLVNIPTASSTSAFINSTTTFTVTVTSLDDVNLITNGDFNAGFSNFTSDYIPGTGGAFGLLSNEGEYAVSTNPSLTHTNFASCGDHTGGGNMMVVNGAGTANQDVLCQTVNVTPFTDYAFSAWVMSVISEAPAQLQFSVNGALLGNVFTAPSATCVWSNFYQEWNSGPNSSVEICMVNQNTAASGNDFAVDDLFFGEICEAMDQVTVIVQPTDASWTPPTGLCPLSPPFDLNTLLDPGATPGGFWTINNLPSTFFDPLLLGPGAHQVTYTVGTPPCVAMETNFIIIDPLPSPDWTIPQDLCTGSAPFLLNDLLNPNATPGGTWTVNGQIATFISPSELGAGTHTVAYSVGTLPCVATLEQEIEISAAPLADWNPPAPLCVEDGPFNLNNLLDPDSEPGGTWTINGTPTPTFNPSTLGVGTHSVTYLVGTFPCDASVTFPIVVNEGPEAPVLDCAEVNSNSVTISWTDVPGATNYVVDVISGQAGTIDGNSITVGNLPANEVVQVVVYAEDATGCAGTPDTISCQPMDCMAPEVTIAAVDSICFDSSLQTIALMATVDPTGGTGEWEGMGIADSLNGIFDPVLAGTGEHLITYSYTFDGCSTTDSIYIFISSPPIADFDLPELVCSRDTIDVTFTGSAGSNAIYTWDFDGGAVIDGEDEGPYLVRWEEGGMKEVTLIVEEPGCIADTISYTTQVDLPIEPPMVECDPTLSTITFTWNDVDNVQAYIVSVLNGPLGTITSDTSYLVENLNPEQEIGLRMLLISSNGCPDSLIFPLCETIACPGGPVINELPPLCNGNVGDTLQLSYGFPDSIEVVGNTIIWSGNGVIDSLDGTFVVDSSMLGQDNEVYLWFYNGFCSYRDTLIFNILPELAVDFNMIDTTCITDTVQVSFAGGIAPTTMYDWDFGTANVLSGSGPGPYQLIWDNPGIQSVSLQISDGDCSSPVLTKDIVIESPLDTPEINCTADFTSILFEWNNIAGAAGFQVNVLEGPPGQLITPTSYLVDGLVPGQEVEIELIVESANSCPNSTATLSCSTPDCPDITIDLEEVAPICYSGTDTIGLAWSIMGDTTGGNLFFTGENLLDTLNGLFLIDSSRIGQTTTIFLHFSNGVCLYSDSIDIEILPTPVAAFSLMENVCLGTTDTLLFTGTAGPGALFNWNFSGQPFQPGTGAGPHAITWNTPGTYTISLSIEENGCISNEFTRTVMVKSPLPEPMINCSADNTTISIDWTDIAQASGYYLAMPNGLETTWLSDTSLIIENLSPGTSIDFSLTVIDTTACPDQIYDFTCETLSCPEINLSWSATSPICLGDSSVVTFTFTGEEESGPYDITINDGLNDVQYTGITNGSTISIAPQITTILSVLAIANTALPACQIGFPEDLTIVVNNPVDAGTALPALELCSGMDTLVNLIDLIEGADAGGVWVETSALPATPGAFNATNGTLNIAPLDAGSYTFEYRLTAMAPCANDTTAIEIIVHPTPEMTWDAVSPICQGETSTITLSFSESASGPFDVLVSSGGTDTLYTNLNDGSTIVVSPGSTTTFSVSSISNSPVTDCPVIQPSPIEVIVNQPVDAGMPLPPFEWCSGVDTLISLADLLQGSTSGGIWEETSGSPSAPGAFNAPTGTFRPGMVASGTYTFNYRLTAAEPCPNSSAEVTVIVHATPIADAGEDLTLDCVFNTGSIGGSGTSVGPNIIYEWIMDDTGNILDHTRAITDVNMPGTYNLTVVDTLTGCQSSDEVIVNNEIAFLLPDISISNITCFQANDGLINITAVNGGTPPYSYFLNEQSMGGQSFFGQLGPGTYDIRIVDSEGCEVTLNFNLEEPDQLDVQLVANIEGNENVIQLGDEIILNALVNIPIERIDTILWQPDSLNAKFPDEIALSPQYTSTFGVTVIDTSGCSASDQLTVFVRRDRDVYIPNSFSPNNDGTNDVAMIFAGQEVKEIKFFRIFNRWGEMLFEDSNFQPNNPDHGWDGWHRGQPLNPAVFVYYAEIEMIDGEILIYKGDITLIK